MPLLTTNEDGERRVVVDSGHDRELGVLWLRLDAAPSVRWQSVFDDERRHLAAAMVVYGSHILCTASVDDCRRATRIARRVIGATNGATHGANYGEAVGAPKTAATA